MHIFILLSLSTFYSALLLAGRLELLTRIVIQPPCLLALLVIFFVVLFIFWFLSSVATWLQHRAVILFFILKDQPSVNLYVFFSLVELCSAVEEIIHGMVLSSPLLLRCSSLLRYLLN